MDKTLPPDEPGHMNTCSEMNPILLGESLLLNPPHYKVFLSSCSFLFILIYSEGYIMVCTDLV